MPGHTEGKHVTRINGVRVQARDLLASDVIATVHLIRPLFPLVHDIGKRANWADHLPIATHQELKMAAVLAYGEISGSS